MTELLSRSQEMLKHAQAGEWEVVIEEEVQRRHLLEKFFSMPSNVKNLPGIAEAIREMLSLNEKLQKIAIKARKNANDEADAIFSGRRAVGAYAKNSR